MNALSQVNVRASGLDATYTDFSADWMDPVEALTRFSPSERIEIEGDLVGETIDTRYGIRVAGVGMLISVREQCEFMLRLPVSRVPNTPTWFSGLMNMRGALVPVFDLSLLFGTSVESGEVLPTLQEKKMLMVLGRGEMAAGLLIDGFPHSIIGATPLDETPPLPEVLSPHVGSSFLHNSAVWVELQHEGFFEALGRRIAA